MTGDADSKDGLVPVASISRLNLQIMPADSDNQLLRQDKMYYSAYRYDKEKKQLTTIFYCQNLLQEKDPDELWSRTGEGWRSECFTADLKGNYYVLEGLNEGQGNFLRLTKYNQKKEQVFQKDYPDTHISIQDSASIAGIVASEEGNLCFYSPDGLLIFCDESGNLINSLKLDATGVEGIAFGPRGKAFAFSRSEEMIELYQIDLEEGTVKDGDPCASFPVTTFHPQALVFSGYEDGIYVAAKEGLWLYKPANNTSSLQFSWDDSRLNIDGNKVRSVSRLHSGNFLVLLWNPPGHEGEQAEIAFLEKSSLPEREVITLGVVGYDYWATEDYIKLYNRQSQDREVKLIRYGDPDGYGRDAVLEGVTQLNLALAKGEGPDLIDLTNISAEGMAANGFLEDLEGYFQESRTVAKEDILEQVWQAGMINGKMSGVIPSFSISTLISKNPEQKVGWTVEEALSLSKGKDWDYLLEYMKPIQLYDLVVNKNSDYFVDYNEGKSYFNSEEFISLLEQLQKIDYCEEIPPSYRSWSDGEAEREFMNGNYLLQYAYISNMEDYIGTSQKCGNQISWVGYPDVKGEPMHRLSASCRIGINSSSDHKEGAWAFLEFLLSDAIQNQKKADDLGRFPVRKDAFENFLVNNSYWKPGDRVNSMYRQPEEADFQAVRDIVKYGKFHRRNDYNDPIDIILDEEGSAFLEGDSTAKETANNIHRRVQLYLDEM